MKQLLMVRTWLNKIISNSIRISQDCSKIFPTPYPTPYVKTLSSGDCCREKCENEMGGKQIKVPLWYEDHKNHENCRRSVILLLRNEN